MNRFFRRMMNDKRMIRLKENTKKLLGKDFTDEEFEEAFEIAFNNYIDEQKRRVQFWKKK